MELERDIRFVIVTQLKDENSIESSKTKPNEYKIRFIDQFKTVEEFNSPDDNCTPEYVDGLQMKRRFVKSKHMETFTKGQDRLIEITEPTRDQPYIDVYKHYPIDSFDLCIISSRITHKTMSINDWWSIFKTLLPKSIDKNTDDDGDNEKLIRLLCSPAFNIPLPKQLSQQAACLIKFYEMFKGSLFPIIRQSASSSSLLSTVSHVLPLIQLSIRPKIVEWFDERIRTHKRLKKFRENNCICLAASGSKATSFQYDFSLMEYHIISQFNASEWQLNTLVKRFAMKHLRCTLDNYFLRTSVLWICEIHELENYHHIFEVWVSFMRDVCRKKHLAHYFLENVDIYEEHRGLADTINRIDYTNIDLFVEKLQENLIFPYVHQYTDRMKCLLKYFQYQPVLSFKMKMIYNVYIKPQFPNANCSIEEMCSILCHLSFLEDDDRENITNFWDQQWKPLFIDFNREDIAVIQSNSLDYRPDQLAQQMTTSVFKLIQMDLQQMISVLKSPSTTSK
ncbi:unnamed protein product [Adineta ricciae]|uniref:Uncharacterized protein n=1 Tax=Adineta ricciae TaxID=249248 RepID=A0A814B9D5_ADIRI|nr:unnamed protein product [Adineta ricciae]